MMISLKSQANLKQNAKSGTDPLQYRNIWKFQKQKNTIITIKEKLVI